MFTKSTKSGVHCPEPIYYVAIFLPRIGKIIDEITCLQNEYNNLVNEATTEWNNAKQWFEEQLLGTDYAKKL